MNFPHAMTRALATLALLVASAGALAEPPSNLLGAAQSAADAGDYRRAAELLDSIAPNSLDNARQTQLYTLRAQILLARDQPAEALKWLPLSGLSAQQASQVHWLRAQALFRIGNGPSATYELVQRERYLSPAQLTENRDAIWAGLFETPMDGDVLERMRNLDAQTRGWVELAVLVRERGNVEAWRASYPGHPGAERIGSVVAAPVQSASLGTRLMGFLGGRPESDTVALLLPLTGAYSATAEAVRDGYLSAYFKKGGGQPAVRVYDAGVTPSGAVAAYQQALRDGTGFIVGPLRKEAVAAILDLGQPPVPMLALNYLDSSQPVFNLFQFGLAPEDEARAAAERAVAEGGRRAIAFVPAADWGERALAAFTQRLQELGGSVLASSTYALGARDFSAPIKQLMSLEDSEARHRALSNTLARNSEFEPRRRDDVDFIFIVARPAEGHMIWPQFRYHRSGGLPTYATSLIFAGGSDIELNGLRFCDMPWMIGSKPALTSLREDAAGLASLKSQPRLFALGYDAYMLTQLIRKGDLQPSAGYPAASGELRLGVNGAIGRRLDCVQVESGKPVPLEAPPRS